MSYSKLETVLIDHANQITTITLNRPGSKNAMNPQLHRDMCVALKEAEENEDCRVVVLTGAGNSFCAGMDIKEHFYVGETEPKVRKASREAAFEWMFRRLRTMSKPTIAAVNGWCFGAAFSWLALCDFAIAAESAQFGLSEINWGIIPAGGVTKLTSMMVPRRDALEMILTGRRIAAQEAATMRLINRAVPDAELKTAVVELAEELKTKHPTVLAFCKEVFRVDAELNFENALLYESAKWAELDGAANKTWHKGVQQFKEDKSYRPGIGSYDWSK